MRIVLYLRSAGPLDSSDGFKFGVCNLLRFHVTYVEWRTHVHDTVKSVAMKHGKGNYNYMTSAVGIYNN
jgi:hypothetical protein